MKIFFALLAVIYLFSTSASYAAICCYKEDSKNHEMQDCHNKSQDEQIKSEKKCEFECSLFNLTKFINITNQLNIKSSPEEFTFNYSEVFLSYNSSVLQRPPKNFV